MHVRVQMSFGGDNIQREGVGGGGGGGGTCRFCLTESSLLLVCHMVLQYPGQQFAFLDLLALDYGD